MRSENIELKSDLENLFKDLEEAKRESQNVVPISKPKIEQSDIKNLLSGLEEASKEARVVERKRRDYVETTPDDLSNLIKDLEEVSKQTTKKEEIAEQVKIDVNSLENLMKELSVAYEESKNEVIKDVVLEPKSVEVVDESAKIEEFEHLFSELADVKSEPEPEVIEEFVDNVIVGFEEESDEDVIKIYAEQIKNTAPKQKPQQHDVYQTDISTLEGLTKEFTRFKARIVEQLGSLGGSGEVNLSKLDDVNVSGQEDGDVLTFNKSTGKYVLKSSTSTTNTGQLLSDEEINLELELGSGNIVLNGTDSDSAHAGENIRLDLGDDTNVVFNATDPSGTSEGDDVLLEAGVGGSRDLDYTVLQDLTSDIIPAQTGKINLGSVTNRFKNIFLESNTIDLGGSTISSDGTGQIIVSATGAVLPVGSKTTDEKELLTVLPTTTEADETLPSFADQGALRAQSTRTIPLFTRAGDGTVDTSGTPNVSFTFANTLARRSVYTNSGFSFLLSNGTQRSDLTPEIFEF